METSRARAPHSRGAGRRSGNPARRDDRVERPLLDRILNTPHLAHLVPRLQPELLHRVIGSCGLEDCAELVALATPDQLARVLDLDLWRTRQPGLDEQFDADRFGVWLEVLMESGASAAAQTLAEMDANLVTAGLAQHVLVFDPAAVMPLASMDGEELAAVRTLDDGLSCDVGGYTVVARSAKSWNPIVAVLIALDAEHSGCFHRVMQGCRTLSNSRPEVDGLHDLLTDGEQVMFDLAFDRERRREEEGYVTPARARAFLQASRQLSLGRDPVPPANPIACAHFRAIDEATTADASRVRRRARAGSDSPSVSADPAGSVAAVVEILWETGVLAPQPRALLDGPQGHAARLARIRAQLQFACDSDPTAYSMRSEELAYLANAIMTGCSIQARPFTVQEASDAAVAVCNLGLENWPSRWLPEEARCGTSVVEAGTALPADFLVVHDLVSVFQVGWTILHEDVCMHTAERLIGLLTDLRCDDRETQTGLDALRMEMARQWQSGAPWRARDALDVIATLDMPAWATLLALLDECPVIHAGIGASRGSRARAVSASAFEFISENTQIASVREFLELLPDTLRG